MTTEPDAELRDSLIKIVDPMIFADGSVHKDDTRIERIEALFTKHQDRLLQELLTELPKRPASIVPEGEETHYTYNDGIRDFHNQVVELIKQRMGDTE